ncbi:MAG TPA: hypothetical protein VHJ78_10385 [Actinomycetota bacterium]|nr:hypothetical protein [Actinomycetota bacterium]
MQPTWKRSGLAVMALMVCGAVFLAIPAIAQTVLGTFTANSQGVFSGTVTIPSNTPPGIYDLRATGVGPQATPYPPTSTGSLNVSRNVVVPGQTIAVAGGGFAPNSPVTVTLHFVASAGSQMTIAQTNTLRILTARIRVVDIDDDDDDDDDVTGGNVIINNDNRVSCTSNATAADSGQYQIAQTSGDININNNNSARCESIATATGAAKKIEQTPVTKPVTKVLARTGVDALPLLAAAIATILLGSVLLSAGRRRDRFEGSLRSA